jgi:hypothetical protein
MTKFSTLLAMAALSAGMLSAAANAKLTTLTWVTENGQIVFNVDYNQITHTIVGGGPLSVDSAHSFLNLNSGVNTVTSLSSYAFSNNLFDLTYNGLSVHTTGPNGPVDVNFYNRNYFNPGGAFNRFTGFFNAAFTNSVFDPAGAAPVFFPISYTATLGAVPEPASWAMMFVGFGLVGLMARGRQHRAVSV